VLKILCATYFVASITVRDPRSFDMGPGV